MDITPSDPAATGTWDQAPVQVGITTARVPNALTVPVNALLARSNGGYAVEVVGASGTNHLVPVSLGLFDDAEGLVQVAGSRLAAGQKSRGPVGVRTRSRIVHAAAALRPPTRYQLRCSRSTT